MRVPYYYHKTNMYQTSRLFSALAWPIQSDPSAYCKLGTYIPQITPELLFTGSLQDGHMRFGMELVMFLQ